MFSNEGSIQLGTVVYLLKTVKNIDNDRRLVVFGGAISSVVADKGVKNKVLFENELILTYQWRSMRRS